MIMDILINIFYFFLLISFFYFFKKIFDKIGILLSLVLILFFAVNLFFLLQAPYYSDDIYNFSVSGGILNNFFTKVFNSYHYGRFPLTIFVMMKILNSFYSMSQIGHLVLFLTNTVSVFILVLLFDNFFKFTKEYFLCLLLILFSLPSQVENLLWLASIHENLSLMFALISLFLMKIFFKSKNPTFLFLTYLFQLLSIASSEIGFLFFPAHFFLLFLLDPKQIKKNIWYALKILAPLAIMIVVYRLIITFLANESIAASPYVLANKIKDLTFFSKEIFLFTIFPILKKLPLFLIFTVVLFLIVYHFSISSVFLTRLNKKRKVFLFVFSGLCIYFIFSSTFLHALPSVSFGYNFPRYSYLVGFFLITLILIWINELISENFFKLVLASLLVLFFISNWFTEILFLIPNNRSYVTSFSDNLPSIANEIKTKSLCLFSFSSNLDYKIVPLIRKYDLLQWNHGIIGYFNSGIIENTSDLIVAMPLDAQSDHSLTELNITLTGSYWNKYGNNPEAVLNLLNENKIKRLYHFHYDGHHLKMIPIQKVFFYNQDFSDQLAILNILF